MKLRITKKKSKNDITMLDLKKAILIRQIPDGRKRLILEITFGANCCFAFRDSECIFEELEISGNGIMYFYEKTVQEIVKYAMIDND